MLPLLSCRAGMRSCLRHAVRHVLNAHVLAGETRVLGTA